MSFNIVNTSTSNNYTSFNYTPPSALDAMKGTYINVNNGQSDSTTIGATTGNMLIWGDSGDTIHLSNAWHVATNPDGTPATNVKDNLSGFYGNIYQDNAGHSLMVAGDAAKNVDIAGGTPTSPFDDPALKLLAGRLDGSPALGDPSAPEVQPDADGKKSQTDISNDMAKMEAYLKAQGTDGAVDGKLTAAEIKQAVTNGNLFTGDNKQYWTGVSDRMAFEESQGATNDDDYGHFIVLNKDNYGNYTADAASISTAQAQNNFIAQGADGFS
jgi:hypothetical protein